jgi:UDP-2,3-diacylglucosamine pyrophosphatase LpxH
MPRNKSIFASDLHLGVIADDSTGGRQFAWVLDEDEAAHDFASFVRAVNADPDVAEVVLLGDIFDTWICPIEMKPPTMDRLLASHAGKTVMTALETLSANPEARTIYLPGNHDMDMTAEILARYLPNIAFASVFEKGRVRAEHGHVYGMFNAPDSSQPLAGELPLGYFMTRLWAWRERPAAGAAPPHSPVARRAIFRDILGIFHKISVARTAWDLVAADAMAPPEAQIVLPDGCGAPPAVTIETVGERFHGLFSKWEAATDLARAAKAFEAEHKLDVVAPTVAADCAANIVVFGHAHEAALERRTSEAGKPFLYANCGSWCEAHKPRTFVEVVRDDFTGVSTVLLAEWRNGAIARVMGAESIVA